MALSSPLSHYIGAKSPASASPHHLKDEKFILRDFIRNMDYSSPDILSTNEALEAAMRAEMDARGIRCDRLEKTLHLSASLIELACHDCDFAEKKNIALFNWYIIYVDDMTTKDAINAFGQRFLRGQPQLDPVLDAFADVLLSMWNQYDSLSANSIIAAVFEFFTSNCIEKEVAGLPLIRGARRFPWFLRERTSGSEAYAFMVFPKRCKVDVLEYIQVIPDMNHWISLVNDLFSFHKEEIAGDRDNYIHVRAYVENKAPLQVLAEVAHELQLSRNIILGALSQNPEAFRAWHNFERGCVAWHLEQDRYNLRDLGLLNAERS